MKKVNRTAEVSQEQKDLARKPWQAPGVEELRVSETENPVNPLGAGDGIYVGS
ncbi:MAG TPA: hypothetical protein VN682_25665 [Terriglobales bacterium]|nr:hypothetical protein [Terriglobales bacterium]